METAKKVKRLCDQAEKNNAFDALTYYYQRWQDEKKYEDWKEYDNAIKNAFKNFNIKKTTKRPFGFQFVIDGETLKMVVKAKRNQLQFNVIT